MKKTTKGFVKIDKVIKYQEKTNKIAESFWKYKAVKHWQEAVEGFFEEAKDLTCAIDFKNGVLMVASLSRELSRKLKIFAEKIIEVLNQILGRQVVCALVIEE